MRLLLLLLGLFTAKVRSDQQAEACPRKEPPPGVLALTLGSEVVLDCSGHVSVDGVPVVMPAKWKDRFGGTQGDTDALRTSQKEVKNTDTSGTFNPTVRNSAATQTTQNTNTAGIYNKLQSAAADSTVKPPVITTEQQKRPSNDFTVGQVTQPQRVGGVSEEGGAFSITMEMGISSERGITAEYEDYEDYEDGDEGLRVTRAIKRQTRWTRSGQRIRSIKRGGALRIPALQLADSGNYSCYRDDRLVWSVNISVGVHPERPVLSCRKKFHSSKVRCEWISTQPVIPRPQCYLLIRKRFQDLPRVSCSYSVERSRCWCAVYSDSDDTRSFTARMCVTNTAGSAISTPLNINPQEIIKPDPPARVVVKPVEGQIHTLHVSWSNPSTWRDTDNFYHLHFHLRYRPVLARQFQEVRIEDGKHIWSVLDALPGTLYEVQLRAKDEYVGMWSEWTSPVYAHTWTVSEPTISSDIYTSLEPFWTFSEGSGSETDSNVEVTEYPANDGRVVWVHVLWVFGLCLLITLTVISILSLRNRYLSKVEKQSCSPPCSCSSPPLSQQPLVAPRQQSQHHFLSEAEEEGEGINLHNFDYFFSPPGD
ncbi:interleukin-6 receptor subunit alpha [Astyanax mexicanus]|uniref:interleukin-6 receptor subunit alpha n=1 Tax=Astyanax mexicanus TaxID=7994 RepID=UPI0020CAFC12|nr:interleukin-6 receptor subunit alpha [Astyanax mexicanus]